MLTRFTASILKEISVWYHCQINMRSSTRDTLRTSGFRVCLSKLVIKYVTVFPILAPSSRCCWKPTQRELKKKKAQFDDGKASKQIKHNVKSNWRFKKKKLKCRRSYKQEGAVPLVLILSRGWARRLHSRYVNRPIMNLACLNCFFVVLLFLLLK